MSEEDRSSPRQASSGGGRGWQEEVGSGCFWAREDRIGGQLGLGGGLDLRQHVPNPNPQSQA